MLGTIDIRMPLYAPATWARRAEAEEATGVATLSGAETRRQTALATADAYLTILARRKVLESNIRSRDTSRAHFDLASRARGARHRQPVQSPAGAAGGVEQRDLHRSGPLCGLPGAGSARRAAGRRRTGGCRRRAELRAFRGQRRRRNRTAAQHPRRLEAVRRRGDGGRTHARECLKSRLPLVQGIFQPQATYPAQFFTPRATWRLLFQVDVPIFDSGTRSADRTLRQSALDLANATQAGAMTTPSSEVRTAREAVASAERTLASARAAAAQAGEVVNIVNVSFRAGACHQHRGDRCRTDRARYGYRRGGRGGRVAARAARSPDRARTVSLDRKRGEHLARLVEVGSPVAIPRHPRRRRCSAASGSCRTTGSRSCARGPVHLRSSDDREAVGDVRIGTAMHQYLD